MGVAVFIVAEPSDRHFDLDVSGKALARSRLDSRKPGNGLRALDEFFSTSPDEAAAAYSDFLDEAPPPEGGFPPERWFAAADGLATVRALLAYLAANPTDTRNTQAVLDDLHDFERILTALDAAGVRWHLDIDY
ncbi:Uncharacterized protein OS=Candidatus Entotheonella sp. TSY1 GN=ETSY1_37545 PE=4 SV=1 [Gemmata massiliana]|uniref:Uncharacterized protein n=1 Tax=Gemmata massiliana TaxID=1210884 RepID=A0A6P2D680_9BACT|nr:hypothetical protein [Gemmata massiliana]VTR94982.1 Uncharacterized protein OS=Candidatus Entotheonella sp. TSY1 GN=ETSY1_37545 PE=4 SV=1 [Gemmata massiliana]